MVWGMPTVADVLQIAAGPASGTTVATAGNTTVLLINNTSLLLALTITLPANPIDLQKFTVACNAAITVMTVTGGTVWGLLSTLSAGGFMKLQYSAQLGIWFRTG